MSSIVSTYIEGIENPRVKLSPAARTAVEALGMTPVAAVIRADVIAVYDSLRPGIGEQFLAIVSSFFGWAYERGMAENNPARNRLKLTGGRRIRRRRLTDKELLAIWRAFEADGDPASARSSCSC